MSYLRMLKFIAVAVAGFFCLLIGTMLVPLGATLMIVTGLLLKPVLIFVGGCALFALGVFCFYCLQEPTR